MNRVDYHRVNYSHSITEGFVFLSLAVLILRKSLWSGPAWRIIPHCQFQTNLRIDLDSSCDWGGGQGWLHCQGTFICVFLRPPLHRAWFRTFYCWVIFLASFDELSVKACRGGINVIYLSANARLMINFSLTLLLDFQPLLKIFGVQILRSVAFMSGVDLAFSKGCQRFSPFAHPWFIIQLWLAVGTMPVDQQFFAVLLLSDRDWPVDFGNGSSPLSPFKRRK